jgi:hypothetical protein
MLAATRAFMSVCVLITAIAGRWDGASGRMSALLKCSEILAFTGPLWPGGADYYKTYRQIVKAI